VLDQVNEAYPIISRKDLSPALFGEMMRRHRCVLVRDLVGMSDTLTLRGLAETTYRTFDRLSAEPRPTALAGDDDYLEEIAVGEGLETSRWFRQYGSILLSHCPLSAGTLLEILSKSPILPCIKDYFGDEIGLALNASSIRLSEPISTVRRVFHQDGNFLGGVDAETINCWIALDPCGVDAPTMEVFPRRVDDLLKAGTEGATTQWEIAESVVYGRLGKENAWIPEFQPGDAFLFDHLHVHRTHLTETMTRSRYAMESWMFPIKERYRGELLAWIG